MSTESLKPCPFCGCAPAVSEFVANDEGDTRWAVACDCLNAPEDQPYAERYVNVLGPDRAAAVAAWNRRAEPLTADFTRALPGGKLDDATYEAIEDALDRAEAPCTIDGRWLTLPERVDALARSIPETSSQ